MCKKLKNPAMAIVIAVLSLSFAGPAFAAGQALTGTVKPSPVGPAQAGQGQALTGTQAGQGQALTGTQAVNEISGQGLTGTQPKTVNIPIPLTGRSIPLTGTVSGSGGTGVVLGINILTVRFP